MASATIEVFGGASVTAPQGFNIVVSVGAGVAAGATNWSVSGETRAKNNWLPRADHAIGTCPKCRTPIPADPVYYRWFSEVSARLGGINGQTIPQVVTTVQQTQAVVVDTTATLTETIAYARSIDATASALAQVATDNGLSGSGTVPEPSDPPNPPGTQPF